MDEVSIKAAAVEIEQNHTQLSLLINNAGIPGKEYVGYETPLEDLKATMQVNFFGTYLLINQLTGLLHQNQAQSSILRCQLMPIIFGTHSPIKQVRALKMWWRLRWGFRLNNKRKTY